MLRFVHSKATPGVRGESDLLNIVGTHYKWRSRGWNRTNRPHFHKDANPFPADPNGKGFVVTFKAIANAEMRDDVIFRNEGAGSIALRTFERAYPQFGIDLRLDPGLNPGIARETQQLAFGVPKRLGERHCVVDAILYGGG